METTNDKDMKVISEEDIKKVVKILKRFGYKKEEAMAIAFFLNNREGKSKDIADAMKIKQPQVSTGTKALRKEGFLTVEPCKKEKGAYAEGKGAPENLYTAVPRNEMLVLIEEKARAKIEKIKEDLKELRMLLYCNG